MSKKIDLNNRVHNFQNKFKKPKNRAIKFTLLLHVISGLEGYFGTVFTVLNIFSQSVGN